MDNDFDRAIDTDEGYRDGESFCDEPVPNCPTCGKEGPFAEREDAEEVWLECKACGAKTDDNELEDLRAQLAQREGFIQNYMHATVIEREDARELAALEAQADRDAQAYEDATEPTDRCAW